MFNIFRKKSRAIPLTEELTAALDTFQQAKNNLSAVVEKCEEQARKAEEEREVAQRHFELAMERAEKLQTEANGVMGRTRRSLNYINLILADDDADGVPDAVEAVVEHVKELDHHPV